MISNMNARFGEAVSELPQALKLVWFHAPTFRIRFERMLLLGVCIELQETFYAIQTTIFLRINGNMMLNSKYTYACKRV